MNLVFLGPPGAGKGTMASRLATQRQIPHISTGDIIRTAIRNESELGKKVRVIVESGDLVPDDLTIALVEERLAKPDTQSGFILDGFPRTTVQADALLAMQSIDKALNFVLSEEAIIERLSGRRIHKASGRTYHVLFNPPKVENKDDITGEELITRPDDQREAITRRLAVYQEQTAPLIEYFAQKKLLVDIDASDRPDSVFANLEKLLA